jgi:serine/threonine-protein kinase SRPK3
MVVLPSDHETHQRLRIERYDVNEERDEHYQYESENEDAEVEDNETGEEEDLFEVEKKGDIRLIDRSFTDLGYIGYGTGIFLEKLDFGPNWQFASN